MKNNPNQKEKAEDFEELKIILLGEVSTGKTSLINVYIKNVFNEKVEPTLNPSYLSKELKIEDKTYLLYLWDTAGQEQFRSMNKIFIKDSNIVIFIYDITRKKTFKELSFWIEYVENCIGKDSAIYGVLGNKLDLFDKEEEIKELKEDYDFELVNSEEGKKFAESIGAEFLETSAKEKAPGFEKFIYKLIDEYRSKNMFLVKSEVITLSSEKSKVNEEKKCCH